MRGHVRKRAKWEFTVDIGPHPLTGRRRQRSKSRFTTKKELKRRTARVHPLRGRRQRPVSPADRRMFGPLQRAGDVLRTCSAW